MTRANNTAHYYYDVLHTPLGWMGLLASPSGLKRTSLPQPSPDQSISIIGAELEEATHCPDHFARLKSRLSLYFGGGAVTFGDEPIDVDDAPPFLRAAWEACRSIPIGETRTYKWLAAQTGRPRAPRAAGQSMAKNRMPIIIPCHRVIAIDGSLRGFGKGASQLDLKERLLRLEAGHTSSLEAFDLLHSYSDSGSNSPSPPRWASRTSLARSR